MSSGEVLDAAGSVITAEIFSLQSVRRGRNALGDNWRGSGSFGFALA